MKTFISSESIKSDFTSKDDLFYDWWTVLMAQYFNVSKTDSQENDFHGFVEFFHVDEIFVKRSKSTPQKMKRDLRLISQMPSDTINISLILKGSFTGESHQKKVAINEGDIIFIDKSEISTANTGYFEEVGIDIPKNLILSNVILTSDFHLMKLSPGDSFYEPMKYHILKLYDHIPDNGTDNRVLVRSTLELIRSILTNIGYKSFAETLSDDYILHRIYTYIEQHYQDRDLSADNIARSINLSRSRLYRVTEPLGGINSLINNIRVKKALFTLQELNFSKMSLLSLQETSGYKSERTFRRAFLSVINMTPQEAYNHLLEEFSRFDRIIKKHNSNPLIDQNFYQQWLSSSIRGRNTQV